MIGVGDRDCNDRGLKRSLYFAAEVMKPVVDGDAPHRSSDATFHERGQHAIRGQSLDVDAHRFEHDVVGELRTCTGLIAPAGEAALARLANESLQWLQRSG